MLGVMQTAADQLTAAGLPTAIDPADVRVPGAWLSLDTLTMVNVAHDHAVATVVYLIAADAGAPRAITDLGQLYGVLLTIATPDGPVAATRVVLPASPTPLPALSVPLNLYTPQE